MNQLDLVSFDTAGFDAQGDRDGVRVWYSVAGDGVGLFYFAVPPDIDADLENIDNIRAFYRKAASESGSAIIEVETPIVQECRSVRTIIKVPQHPTGMTYMGSLTLPFRDFSYVLKVGCVEKGMTGEREAVVLAQFLKNGEISVSPDRRIDGWMADPYDASVDAPLMRNRAETKEYDPRFPDHPLSRARRVLDHIQTTITIASDLRKSPPFEYLGPRHDPKPWWRVW